MSIIVLKDVQIIFKPSSTSVTAYDLSDHIRSITLSTSYDLFETTQITDTAKKRVPGLADNSVTFEFLQDFDSALTMEQVFNDYDSNVSPDTSWIGTIRWCEIKPKSSAVSVTNPKYAFEVTLSEWTPLNGEAGAISTVNVTWPIYGQIYKYTT